MRVTRAKRLFVAYRSKGDRTGSGAAGSIPLRATPDSRAFWCCWSGRVWRCPPAGKRSLGTSGSRGEFGSARPKRAVSYCTSGRGGGNHLRRRRFPPPLPGPPLYFPWLCVRRVYESACNAHCTLRVLAWFINGVVEMSISCHIYLFVCYKKCLSAADVWILAPNVGGAPV